MNVNLRLVALASSAALWTPASAGTLACTGGIATEGEGANGIIDSNTSRVATPLLHTVWKFDAASRDQLRASLTRSYRSPNGLVT